MADLSDLLRPDAVLFGLAAASKKALFAATAATLACQTGIEVGVIADALADREKLGSTGFGGGVAIPHARASGVDAVTAVFARLAQPLAFAAVDGEPVDLVWVQLSSPDAGADHLKALARVSRRLRDRPFLAKLRGAGSPDALYALFTEDRARDAA
ncbi:PTS sugar transporter subunit IIA [Sphingomonas bacterium]|uniref:PTS sugar transporter subunit IIA n=1 Tax=Sphingomonas bacterium TaxID=1895847 RepID=UPI0015751976|nr:PTS sugar transporter subunit IIA [Sphingomonas bacterium]